MALAAVVCLGLPPSGGSAWGQPQPLTAPPEQRRALRATTSDPAAARARAHRRKRPSAPGHPAPSVSPKPGSRDSSATTTTDHRAGAARARAARGRARAAQARQARQAQASGQQTIALASFTPSEAAAACHRAQRALRAGDLPRAQQALVGQSSPAAALMRARIAIAQSDLPAAHAALAAVGQDANLAVYATIERGRLALLEGDPGFAATQLAPVAATSHFWASRAVLPLAQSLATAHPSQLLAQAVGMAAKLAPLGANAQSELVGYLAQAHRNLGEVSAACESEVRQFTGWPAATTTPSAPPSCRPLRLAEATARIERLAEANRNDAAQSELDAMAATLTGAPAALPAPQNCQVAFLQGMVARKRRRYAQAEAAFDRALVHCHDESLRRRAQFTRAKVISIQDGLRAIAPIEEFAREHGSHSMVDDVLFWAGDSLQRRGRDAEASAYYRRILAQPKLDDQCVEASWRLAWMAYRRGDMAAAKKQLRSSLSSRCHQEPWHVARVHYWLGRIAQAAANSGSNKAAARAEAAAHFRAATHAAPLHFYAQSALTQWSQSVSPTVRAALLARYARPAVGLQASALCPGSLSSHRAFSEGLFLLSQGLLNEAKAALLRVNAAPNAFAAERPAPLRQCGRRQAVLLLCAALEASGAYRESRARLYSEFAQELAGWPTADMLPVWQRAYPLAFREPLAHAEEESGLPPFLLQALAREESTFDPDVVSWAEAGGLTQLLLASGQTAGRSLSPPVGVRSLDQLLEPELNARLGGALLGLYGRRLQSNWPLALAAYNGGYDTAKSWWKRFGGGELAIFAEEMTVRETRMYVQRVLQTLGIYRWLYTGLPPMLAAQPLLPPFGAAAAGSPDAPAR